MRNDMRGKLVIFISLILLCVSFYQFMSGLHSMDLAWNSYRNSNELVKFTNEQLRINNSTFTLSLEGQTDIDNRFQERTLDEVYTFGFNYLTEGFAYCLFSVFLIGYFLAKA